MPNTTLTPRDLKKINKEISLDQQVLQQLTPELLDSILKTKNKKRIKHINNHKIQKDPKIIDLIEQIATGDVALHNKIITPSNWNQQTK